MANINIDALRKRLGSNIKREVSILRQVVYKELQMWKRHITKDIPSGELANTFVEFFKVTETEKEMIDREIQWFIMGDIPDSLIEAYARSIVKDLSETTSMTVAQKGLYDDLKKALENKPNKTMKDALTVDEAPF